MGMICRVPAVVRGNRASDPARRLTLLSLPDEQRRELSPDLALKPDIGAPGGLIRSTYPLELGGYATIAWASPREYPTADPCGNHASARLGDGQARRTERGATHSIQRRCLPDGAALLLERPPWAGCGYGRKPRSGAAKRPRFGKTSGRSVRATPNHRASVAEYSSTEIDGIQRPSRVSSGPLTCRTGNRP